MDPDLFRVNFGVGDNIGFSVNHFDDPVHSGMVVERNPASATDHEDSDGNVAVFVDSDVRHRSVSENPRISL